MKTISIKIILSLLLISGFETSVGQNSSYTIQLKNRAFIPEARSDPYFDHLQQIRSMNYQLISGKIHALLQFYSIPDESHRQRLSNLGIQLHDYIPENSFTASMPTNLTENDFRQSGIRAVVIFEPADKLSELFQYEVINLWARPIPGKLDVIIRYYPDVDNLLAQETMISLGGEILYSSPYFERLTVRINQGILNNLASLEWVSWIEPVPPPPTTFNDGSRASIRVNEIQSAPYNLTASGVRLGMWDGGRVDAHDGFSGRLNIIENVSVNSHATHVAGTMAGSGAGSENNVLRGMSIQAPIYSWDFNGDVPTEMLNGRNNQLIVVSQNSWGADMWYWTGQLGDVFGVYAQESRDYDRLIRDNGLQIVFAAGNDRDKNWYLQYRTTGYRSLSYGYGQCSKNTIVVGAITKTDQMTTFSAWGPAIDGRLKPDVVAVGYAVNSTLPGNTYSGYDPNWSGTSMAAPAVSGAIGLLVQRYRQINSGSDPSPTLVKSILLNTATDLGNPGPDYSYGYGKVDALEAVKVIERQTFLAANISQGATNNHSLQVPSGLTRMRVLLAYADKEAADNANPTLVNNLDIKLIAPNAQEFLPLTLDPDNPSANASSAVNNRDNIEQIVVNNPTAGTWTIRVTAPTVPFGPQSYVVTWDIPSINVTIYQRLQDGTPVGTIGRWNGSSFDPRFPSGTQLQFEIGTTEVLHGDTNIYSTQKYHQWFEGQNPEPDVKNHHIFPIIAGLPEELTSRFHPTDPTITIKTDLVDLPGTTGGDIQFRDPWYIDYQDPQYGYNWRNRGMQEARYLTRSLTNQFVNGWQPDFTTTYPESPNHPYRGVFLNQDYNDPGVPYYSVGAPSPNTIGGYESYFVNWTGHPDSVEYQNANAQQTAVVFKTANATAVAKYKAHLASSLAGATGSNSQRKLAGYDYLSLSLGYPSAGEIWLTEC
jgi:hypothetical protein